MRSRKLSRNGITGKGAQWVSGLGPMLVPASAIPGFAHAVVYAIHRHSPAAERDRVAA
ncbi:hypothetical protein P3102_09525 [Amycolatopsis sp. QT-25]|uniref:hypothetical protein n=1 Tax=Amycolatopsis sp. QT-25 TaxID=3034022 RepID=UPI0023ECFA52|nr:hypothetical protein [Amycolatopsis sp. QT-25]WET81428.1 hypothetical protein P3102_09525 [Amycolatopsis sp. QT-25]